MSTQLWPILVSGCLMVIVGVAAIAIWRRKTNARAGWFAIGAGLWFGAVVVKILLALLLSEHVLAFLKATLPRIGYLAVGSAYTGLLSRLLVLMAFATRRRSLAVWGFLLFALLDSIAGLAHISGWLKGGMSVWWIELMLAPVAVASVLIIRWAYPRYLAPTVD